ncbi:elongation factor 2 kinase, putative [Talaromyces stipitatus ATCC 10500]|uniref:Elongation factor 2 kinase, putative n=1 Tax=Talaromyces stipitatus (strain ATCC 10500 / CBS 375.48 / QM 6759 / NRRL 1006) TaxID=441959 RepID=B8MML8_TALSN|nr:elongation factor 2 kinase, putative [Talaromyces stipitatus ATCC 10500]EED13772.1 elongation factor 2 kinase, putative [Talaromyces stipitatus ATCC 10500]
MTRVCARCQQELPKSSFTAYQYSLGRGVSCCVSCDNGYHSVTLYAGRSYSGRYNESGYATVDIRALRNPFAQGTFRWVAMGEYISGPREGRALSEDYFTLDIKAVDKALEIIDQFNRLRFMDKVIKVNIPQVWEFAYGLEEFTGQLFLCEPFIDNYQKFNSNSGWKDDSTSWARAMQALSHFSYHLSGGNHVLCDLQGGIRGDEVILTDPAILSRNGEYGITDTGPEGMVSFFSTHVCNEFCRPHWIRPNAPKQHFSPVPGTMMIPRR